MIGLFLILIIFSAFVCLLSVIIGISVKSKVFPVVSVCCAVMIIALSFSCMIETKNNEPVENSDKVSVSLTHNEKKQSEKKTKSAPVQDENRIVYITKTGKKYHYSYDCSETDFYECTLEEALELGLEPCGNCVK